MTFVRGIAAVAALAALACGARQTPAVEPPVAVAPESARPAEQEVAEAPQEGETSEPVAPDEEEASASVTANATFANGTVTVTSSPSTPAIRWTLVVREPDGTEVHHEQDPLPAVAVEGRQCVVRGASVDQAMSVVNGAITRRLSESREIVCTGQGRDRSGLARCTIETAADGTATPTLEPTTVVLGNPSRPSRVTLKCSVD